MVISKPNTAALRFGPTAAIRPRWRLRQARDPFSWALLPRSWSDAPSRVTRARPCCCCPTSPSMFTSWIPPRGAVPSTAPAPHFKNLLSTEAVKGFFSATGYNRCCFLFHWRFLRAALLSFTPQAVRKRSLAQLESLSLCQSPGQSPLAPRRLLPGMPRCASAFLVL